MSHTEESVNALGNTIGPFYLLEGLIDYFKKPEAEINEAVSRQELLYAITADNVKVFPVWQFDLDGYVSKTLRNVAKILYSAEPRSTKSKDGTPLPGYGWSTLTFLSANFPLGFDEIDVSQPGLEHLADIKTVPVYTHLINGEFVEEIEVEAEEYRFRVTTP